MTCTPIGTAKNRWIIQSKILAPDTIDVTKKIRIYKVTAEFRAIVKIWKDSIDWLATFDLQQEERNRIEAIIIKKWWSKPQRQYYMDYVVHELSL